jgi:hypothetical protein
MYNFELGDEITVKTGWYRGRKAVITEMTAWFVVLRIEGVKRPLRYHKDEVLGSRHYDKF